MLSSLFLAFIAVLSLFTSNAYAHVHGHRNVHARSNVGLKVGGSGEGSNEGSGGSKAVNSNGENSVNKAAKEIIANVETELAECISKLEAAFNTKISIPAIEPSEGLPHDTITWPDSNRTPYVTSLQAEYSSIWNHLTSAVYATVTTTASSTSTRTSQLSISTSTAVRPMTLQTLVSSTHTSSPSSTTSTPVISSSSTHSSTASLEATSTSHASSSSHSSTETPTHPITSTPSLSSSSSTGISTTTSKSSSSTGSSTHSTTSTPSLSSSSSNSLSTTSIISSSSTGTSTHSVTSISSLSSSSTSSVSTTTTTSLSSTSTSTHSTTSTSSVSSSSTDSISTTTTRSSSTGTSTSSISSSSTSSVSSTTTKSSSSSTSTHLTTTTSSIPSSSTSSSISTTSTKSSSSSTSTHLTTSSSSISSSSTTSTKSSSSTSVSSSASATATACAGNTATNRSSWCDYSTSTDYYNVVPVTNVTRHYYFDIVESTASPDGYSRMVMTINGSLPGPTIEANWGDTIVVHVTNSLTNNGTGIHFHGIRQNYTNQMDGVPSITQCPIAPGEAYTYTWRATQYGTSWYHSHFALQAWEGVFGGIIINGPATANYEEDKGVLFLNDWSHQTVDELFDAERSAGPPTMDNGLINGTNVYGDDDSTSQTGTRFETSVVSGTSYRLRIINAAIDTHFKFSIDGHTMTVIEADLVPIVPYTTTVLNVAMAQRYDVIVTADQASTASDFWIRAIPQDACSDNDSTDNIKGILHYGSSTGTPTTTGYTYTDACVDEDSSDLVPYLSETVSTETYESTEDVTHALDSNRYWHWYLNSVAFNSSWADPTLLQVSSGVTSYASSAAVISLPSANKWVYVVVETTQTIPHPIHLHGHDFYVLAQATGTYSSSTTLDLANPPRRDVATLPGSGYLVLAFKTDNPGAWLMHCHIGWHASDGFALQFVEQTSVLETLLDTSVLEDTCTAWEAYVRKDDVVQEDSGI